MSSTPNSQDIFTFSYEFNAPKEMVYNAFADADALNEWWGPPESHNSVISLDFRPGGIFHFKMEHGKNISYGRFLFYRIEPYDLLEFSNAFADERGRVIKPPFDITIPQEIFYRLHFTGSKKKTTITMTGEPVNATPEEIQGFLSINSSMQQGFGATFANLAVYLEKQKT